MMTILTKDELNNALNRVAAGIMDDWARDEITDSHEALREQAEEQTFLAEQLQIVATQCAETAERRLEMMGWLCRQWTRNVGWEVHPNDEEYYAQIRTELEATG